LRELSKHFGLGHPDGAAGLIKRAKARLPKSRQMQREAEAIERKLWTNAATDDPNFGSADEAEGPSWVGSRRRGYR